MSPKVKPEDCRSGTMPENENKNRFHVNYEPIQYTSEKTVFEVELYNKNFELVNSSNVEIEFVDSLENSFKYQFNTLGDKYYLDVELVKQMEE